MGAFLIQKKVFMSRIVRINYFDSDGKQTEEVCYLVEQSDTIVPKTNVETGLTFDLSSLLPDDDKLLLEDDQGLWALNKKDLISIVPATEYELSDYLNRN